MIDHSMVADTLIEGHNGLSHHGYLVFDLGQKSIPPTP
jgi:hypothetical protein